MLELQRRFAPALEDAAAEAAEKATLALGSTADAASCKEVRTTLTSQVAYHTQPRALPPLSLPRPFGRSDG